MKEKVRVRQETDSIPKKEKEEENQNSIDIEKGCLEIVEEKTRNIAARSETSMRGG